MSSMASLRAWGPSRLILEKDGHVGQELKEGSWPRYRPRSLQGTQAEDERVGVCQPPRERVWGGEREGLSESLNNLS